MIVPGPGFYATQSTQVSQKVLGGRFGSALRPQIANKTAKFEPGPNDYKPMINVVKRHVAGPVMPAFQDSLLEAKRRPATSSQISKHMDKSSRNLPGPGQYNPVSSINSQQHNARKSTIGTRFNQAQIQTGMVGPGPTYKPDLNATNVSKPAYNIGGGS